MSEASVDHCSASSAWLWCQVCVAVSGVMFLEVEGVRQRKEGCPQESGQDITSEDTSRDLPFLLRPHL